MNVAAKLNDISFNCPLKHSEIKRIYNGVIACDEMKFGRCILAAETISKFKAFEFRGEKFTICAAPDQYSKRAVTVWAIIRHSNGHNMIPNRCRPADNMTDAIDVAIEMLFDCEF